MKTNNVQRKIEKKKNNHNVECTILCTRRWLDGLHLSPINNEKNDL